MKRYWSGSLLKIAVGALVVFAACLGLERFRAQRAEEPEPEVVRPVRTVKLSGGDGASVRRYFGNVQGSRRVNLSFRVSGPLLELPAEKGAQAKEGDLLARIDPRDFQTSLEQAQGVLAQARATYNDASSNFKRYEELYKQKVIAAAAYDEYKTQLNVAKSAVQKAEAQVTSAQDALRDTELRAPYDGVIVDRMAENFQDVAAKQEIINFQDISTLEIVFNVPDTDVLQAPAAVREALQSDFKASDSFTMTASFDAIPGRTFPLTLKEFEAQADAQTRTYPVTVTMEQPGGARVLPGMAVTVTVDYSGGAKADSYIVPESAVLALDSGEKYVWRYEGGAVSRVPVNVIEWKNGDMFEIQSQDLADGDTLVTAGVYFLKEGQKVRLTKAGDQ